MRSGPHQIVAPAASCGEGQTTKIKVMSDPETSSEASGASAETVGAPAPGRLQRRPRRTRLSRKFREPPWTRAFSAENATQCLRGHHPKSASSGGYKPTAIEVVTAQREYKNPFAPEQSVPSSVVNRACSQSAPPPRTSPSAAAEHRSCSSSIAAETRSPVSSNPRDGPGPAAAAPVGVVRQKRKSELKIPPPKSGSTSRPKLGSEAPSSAGRILPHPNARPPSPPR